MKPTIKIANIISALEFQTKETNSYFNVKTGELITAEQAELDDLENEAPEEIDSKRDLLETDNFVMLPDFYEINEYDLIQAFCTLQKDPQVRAALQALTQGETPIRRFQASLPRFRLADEWKTFRETNFKTTAIRWCEENDFPYE
jgi:hypothetical protein